MSFLLDIDMLQPADIVLQAGTKLHSKAIMAATKGQYSHALLNLGVSLIEATVGGGVFSKNPQRLLVRDVSHLAVYRMRNPLPQSTVDIICKAAQQKVGSLYAIDEALRVLSTEQERFPSNGQFCSRLVAQSYAAGGIKLVNDPDFCSPQSLAESSLLDQVTDVVRLATPADLEFTKTLDIVRRNQKATNRWLKAVRKIAAKEKKEIVTQSDVLPFLLRHPQYDNQIMDCIHRTSYLDNLHHDRKANPFRYNLQGFITALLQKGKIETALQMELRKEPPLIESHGNNLLEYRRHADTGLTFVEAHIALHDGILEMAEERLTVMLAATNLLQLESLSRLCAQLRTKVITYRH